MLELLGQGNELHRLYNIEGHTAAIMFAMGEQQFVMRYNTDTGEWAFKNAPSDIVSLEPTINAVIDAQDF